MIFQIHFLGLIFIRPLDDGIYRYLLIVGAVHYFNCSFEYGRHSAGAGDVVVDTRPGMKNEGIRTETGHINQTTIGRIVSRFIIPIRQNGAPWFFCV